MRVITIAVTFIFLGVCLFSKQLPSILDFVNRHINWVWILGPFSWALYQWKGLVMLLIGFVLFSALVILAFKSRSPLVVKMALFTALLEWLTFGFSFYAPLA